MFAQVAWCGSFLRKQFLQIGVIGDQNFPTLTARLSLLQNASKTSNSNVRCNRRRLDYTHRVLNSVSWYFSYLHPLRVAACSGLIPRFFVSHGSRSCRDREIGPGTPSSCIPGCRRLIRGGAREKERERERKRRLRLFLAEQESSLFVPHAISSNDTWYPPIITIIPWCCDTERTIEQLQLQFGHVASLRTL